MTDSNSAREMKPSVRTRWIVSALVLAFSSGRAILKSILFAGVWGVSTESVRDNPMASVSLALFELGARSAAGTFEGT